MTICIFGAASNNIDPAYLRAGENLGKLIARNGHKIVYGAGSTGLMGAVSRGAMGEGGYVTGVAPVFFDDAVLEQGCNEFIRTETMRQRKQIMDDRAEAFIVTPGGIGTYEEFFEILTLRQLEQTDKPIILLNTLGFYEPLLAMIRTAIAKGFISQRTMNLFFVAQTPEEAYSFATSCKNA